MTGVKKTLVGKERAEVGEGEMKKNERCEEAVKVCV